MKSACVFTHAQNARAVMKIANKFNQELPRLPALRNVFKFHVMFILTMRCNTRQETVSLPKLFLR